MISIFMKKEADKEDIVNMFSKKEERKNTFLASDYVFVAEIPVTNLDEAYSTTQNVDKGWVERQCINFTPEMEKKYERSTMINDIFKRDDIFYRIEVDGFKEVTEAK